MTRWIIQILVLWGIIEFILGRYIPENKNLSEKANLNNIEVYWNYILNKIDETPKIDILILGDSTTRYALDESIISETTGYSTFNAATFGNLATFGNWRLLRYCLERNKTPKAIIFWHSIDVWERKIDEHLFSYCDPSTIETVKNFQKKNQSSEEKSRLPIQVGGSMIRTFFYQLPSIRYRFWWYQCLKIKNLQSNELKMKESSSEKNFNFLVSHTGISEENRYWFKKIAQRCDKEGITVYFARAPLLKSILEDPRNRMQLENQNTQLAQMVAEYSNIVTINSSNVPLEEFETNRDKDHVNKNGRDRISKWHANFLKENPL